MTKTITLAAAAAVLSLCAAGAAQAGDGSVKPGYQFPGGAKGFQLTTHGGAINPGVLVGFNPQPDPPIGRTLTILDLSDPFTGVLRNPMAEGDFRLIFSLTGFGDAHNQLAAPTPGAGLDEVTSFSWFYGPHVVTASFHFLGGGVSEWAAGDVNGDKPPGDAFVQDFHLGAHGGGGGAGITGFSGDLSPGLDLPPPRDGPGADIAFRLTVDGQNVSLAGVPEPASWALMIAGFGLSGAMLRHRRRRAVA